MPIARGVPALLTLVALTGVLAGGATARADRSERFAPISVTFVSPATGWALGTGTCGSSRCLELLRTTSSGRSWSARSLPAALLAAADRKIGGSVAALDDGGPGLEVRFADLADGWIFGELPVPGKFGATDVPVLWATHDGGARWRQDHLRWIRRESSSILDLEAAAGRAYLMVAEFGSDGVSLASSPVSRESWHRSSDVRLGLPAGGAQPGGAFVLHGKAGWLVEGNDRGTTGAARLVSDRWVAWTPPCSAVGGSFAVPAASSSTRLAAACVMGGFASPLSRAAPKGATLGSTWLYLSSNGGRSFSVGPELSDRGEVFVTVLATPSPGVILAGRQSAGTEELQESRDGGRRWSVVYRGDIGYLGFTTPTQGVAIVEPPNGANTLIMSFDGGRRWSLVAFRP